MATIRETITLYEKIATQLSNSIGFEKCIALYINANHAFHTFINDPSVMQVFRNLQTLQYAIITINREIQRTLSQPEWLQAIEAMQNLTTINLNSIALEIDNFNSKVEQFEDLPDIWDSLESDENTFLLNEIAENISLITSNPIEISENPRNTKFDTIQILIAILPVIIFVIQFVYTYSSDKASSQERQEVIRLLEEQNNLKHQEIKLGLESKEKLDNLTKSVDSLLKNINNDLIEKAR